MKLPLGTITLIAMLRLLSAGPPEQPQQGPKASDGRQNNPEPPSQDAGRTGKLLNGRVWVALGAGEKTAWIYGFMDAALEWQADMMLIIRQNGKDPFAEENQPKKLPFSLPRSLTFGEIVESLDRFYAEPTNRVIPIAFALSWVDLKAKGVPETALKEWEASSRAVFSRDSGKN